MNIIIAVIATASHYRYLEDVWLKACADPCGQQALRYQSLSFHIRKHVWECTHMYVEENSGYVGI